jgi:hypothetical protein
MRAALSNRASTTATSSGVTHVQRNAQRDPRFVDLRVAVTVAVAVAFAGQERRARCEALELIGEIRSCRRIFVSVRRSAS